MKTEMVNNDVCSKAFTTLKKLTLSDRLYVVGVIFDSWQEGIFIDDKENCFFPESIGFIPNDIKEYAYRYYLEGASQDGKELEDLSYQSPLEAMFDLSEDAEKTLNLFNGLSLVDKLDYFVPLLSELGSEKLFDSDVRIEGINELDKRVLKDNIDKISRLKSQFNKTSDDNWDTDQFNDDELPY